jgi:hypothetical protein
MSTMTGDSSDLPNDPMTFTPRIPHRWAFRSWGRPGKPGKHDGRAESAGVSSPASASRVDPG